MEISSTKKVPEWNLNVSNTEFTAESFRANKKDAVTLTPECLTVVNYSAHPSDCTISGNYSWN